MIGKIENEYPISHISRLRMGTDGKGIRTLILMHGCPLRCKYCINPKTWNGTDNPKMMTAQELYERICIDRPYLMATGGGLTFGGGEPMKYPGLLNEIRKISEPEMSINVETSLNVEWSNIEESINAIDLFYIDIKTTDSELYKQYTGGELKIPITNLEKLIERKPAEEIIVRIPYVEGFIDKKLQEESKHTLEKMGIKRFDLFKYKLPIENR